MLMIVVIEDRLWWLRWWLARPQGKAHPESAAPDSAGDRQGESSVPSAMRQMTASLVGRLLHLGAKDELVR